MTSEPARPNPFVELARAKKVARILNVIPVSATRRAIAGTADWLAALPQADRDEIAAAAGARPPSEETWRLVVEGARARIPASEAFRGRSVCRARR